MSQGQRKKNLTAIKGTKDILPREVRKWQYAENVIQAWVERYGYREIRTPIFEATELFEKGTGESSDIVLKEMYSFTDKGGRSITLRPEYTPSIARAIIEHRLNLLPEPMRYYFIGPMFRYDKPQKGRYRQFHQVDIEVFGEQDPGIDAEIVEMAAGMLERLQVTDIDILVNSVGCRQCRPDYHLKLQKKARQYQASFCSDCQRKVATNPLRIFDCKIDSCRVLSEELPKITDHLCSDCEDHFRKFRAYLDLFKLSYRVEPRLVRGLDYYTKTTFEVVSSHIGAQDSILGGGRYDYMMADFGGPDICGIGFAMGVERLLSLVPEPARVEKFMYFVCLGEEARRAGARLARFFRQNGFECLIEYKDRSLKNQLGRANKLGASWVLIIGENEVQAQKYQLKDMATGLQQECSQEQVLEYLKSAE